MGFAARFTQGQFKKNYCIVFRHIKHKGAVLPVGKSPWIIADGDSGLTGPEKTCKKYFPTTFVLHTSHTWKAWCSINITCTLSSPLCSYEATVDTETHYMVLCMDQPLFWITGLREQQCPLKAAHRVCVANSHSSSPDHNEQRELCVQVHMRWPMITQTLTCIVLLLLQTQSRQVLEWAQLQSNWHW